MRVLVIGAAGFIGRATTKLLVASGHDVLGADLRPMPVDPAATSGLPLRWQSLDIRSGGHVSAALEDFQPDAVVHLAAKHFIPWCDRFPAATLKTNVLGTQNVVDALCRLGHATRLVFASSAAVYGPSETPVGEHASLGPDDIYGTSKLICERLLELSLRRNPRSSVVALRLFNTIGPGDANAHLVPRLVSELRRDGSRVRVGNLGSVRDYVNVEDVACAILAAVQAELPFGLTVANVGSGVGRSVGEVVEALVALVDRPLEIVSIASRRRVVDRPLLVADPSRARELLGWEPRVPFEAGLASALRAGGVMVAEDSQSPVVPDSTPAPPGGDLQDAPRVLAGAALVG